MLKKEHPALGQMAVSPLKYPGTEVDLPASLRNIGNVTIASSPIGYNCSNSTHVPPPSSSGQKNTRDLFGGESCGGPLRCFTVRYVSAVACWCPDSKSRHEDLRPLISNVAIHEMSDMVFSRRSCISTYITSACAVAAKDSTAATVAQRIHTATGLTAGDFQQLVGPWLTTEGKVQRDPCTLAFLCCLFMIQRCSAKLSPK